MSKALLGAALKAAQFDLEQRRISDEQNWQLSTVIRMASYVGTAEVVDGVRSYKVTASQLRNSGAIIAQRYPHWVQVSDLFHWVAGKFGK